MNRRAEVGDKIVITDVYENEHGVYKVGDVMEVKRIDKDGDVVETDKHTGFIDDSEFIICGENVGRGTEKTLDNGVRVGDRIVITDPHPFSAKDYKPGDIMKVKELLPSGDVCRTDKNHGYITEREYVVVNEEPEPEPEEKFDPEEDTVKVTLDVSAEDFFSDLINGLDVDVKELKKKVSKLESKNDMLESYHANELMKTVKEWEDQ